MKIKTYEEFKNKWQRSGINQLYCRFWDDGGILAEHWYTPSSSGWRDYDGFGYSQFSREARRVGMIKAKDICHWYKI